MLTIGMPACLAGIREARRRDSTEEQAVQRLNRPNFKPVEGTPGSHGNFRGDLDLKLGGPDGSYVVPDDSVVPDLSVRRTV